MPRARKPDEHVDAVDQEADVLAVDAKDRRVLGAGCEGVARHVEEAGANSVDAAGSGRTPDIPI